MGHLQRKPDLQVGDVVQVTDDSDLVNLRGDQGIVKEVTDEWVDGLGPMWLVKVRFFDKWDVTFRPESVIKMIPVQILETDSKNT